MFVRNVFRIRRRTTVALETRESFVVSHVSTPRVHWPVGHREAMWKYSRALFVIQVAEERLQIIVERYACARIQRGTCCLATSMYKVKIAVHTRYGCPRSLRQCPFQRATRTRTPCARHVPLEDVSSVRSISSGNLEASRQISVGNARSAFFAMWNSDERCTSICPSQTKCRYDQGNNEEAEGVTAAEDEGAVEVEVPHRDEAAVEPTTTILPVMPATNAVNPVTLLIAAQMEDSQ
jgi:hypothetical protein